MGEDHPFKNHPTLLVMQLSPDRRVSRGAWSLDLGAWSLLSPRGDETVSMQTTSTGCTGEQERWPKASRYMAFWASYKTRATCRGDEYAARKKQPSKDLVAPRSFFWTSNVEPWHSASG